MFTTDDGYGDDNLVSKDADVCMRIRGPLASTIHDLPDGAQVHLMPEQPPTGTDSGADGTRIAYAELDVFADYNSFFVQDETARFDPDDWTMPLVNDLIAGGNGGSRHCDERIARRRCLCRTTGSKFAAELSRWSPPSHA
ncbi:hypothetical protein ABZU76_49025 [Amycolatopsis sp. NPDC005232]|uniref:hypothetical protein n=1 Tax=Amycolatopsis sp. NPDC005232 TaxID=3157027 RepID=UPI0033AF3C8C